MEDLNFGPNSRKKACPSITNVIYSIFYYRKHLYMYICKIEQFCNKISNFYSSYWISKMFWKLNVWIITIQDIVKLYYKYHLKLHRNSCNKSLNWYHFVVKQTKNSVVFKAWCMAALGTVTVIKFSSIFDTVRKSVLDFLW